MIDGVRHYFALRKLQEKKRRSQDKYRSRLQEAMAVSPTSVLVREAIAHGEHELRLINEEIQALITSRLLEQAQKYEIFWPEDPMEDEERLKVGLGMRRFSPETIEKLRAEIRKERRERWDRVQGPITLLIGLMGALIGVLSLLLT